MSGQFFFSPRPRTRGRSLLSIATRLPSGVTRCQASARLIPTLPFLRPLPYLCTLGASYNSVSPLNNSYSATIYAVVTWPARYYFEPPGANYAVLHTTTTCTSVAGVPPIGLARSLLYPPPKWLERANTTWADSSSACEKRRGQTRTWPMGCGCRVPPPQRRYLLLVH